jgi:succinate dehydrogenase membrane anchor subunit
VLWFAASVVAMAGADHATMTAWLASPVVAVLMSLLIVALFHHTQLGLQVVIEDYVSREAVRWTTMIVMRFAVILLGAASLFSVLKIAFKT